MTRSETTNLAGPLVSVIIPTHNRSHFLAEAIDSICTQTFGDFELIVVDDASSDGTQALLVARSAEDKRIQVISLDANAGCGHARNIALDRARGRYIAFLDDDDLSPPERLEASVKRLNEDPNLDVLATAHRCIDAKSHAYDLPPSPTDFGLDTTDGDVAFERLYCDWAWLPTSSLMLRASAVKNHRFPVFRRPDEDSTVWMQLAASGATFAQLSEPLALIRRDDTYHSMSRDRARLYCARRQTLKSMPTWLATKGITKFDHLHKLAWSNLFMREANYVGGFHGLTLTARALFLNPRSPQAHDYLRLRLRLVIERIKNLNPASAFYAF